MKRQFNVNLPPDLIRRVKYRSIDEQRPLSELIERVLEEHLERVDRMSEKVTLQPMVHVDDIEGTVRMLEVLGDTVTQGSRDGDWVQVTIGGAEVGLLAHPANQEQGEGAIELNFVARVPLEEVEAAARGAGVPVAIPTSDEGYGRQLQPRRPDGLLVKVNEVEPDLIG